MPFQTRTSPAASPVISVPPSARTPTDRSAACGTTGYTGRTGVYELMVADEKVRSLIHSRAAESQLFVAAEAGGLRSMREDGERLVEEGITSPEEVMRVTRE